MLKFSANLSFLFNDLASTYLDKYRLAADYGFRYIESMFPPSNVSLDELVEAQEKYNLKQIVINTEVDLNYGYAAVKGSETLFQASLDKTILYAKTLHIPNVHIMAGKIPTIVTDTESNIAEQQQRSVRTMPKTNDENYVTFKNNLIYACKKLSEHNLTALIEPINSYSIPGYYLNSYTIGIDLIRELNAMNIFNVKLQFDVFHCQLICGDLTHTFERCLPFVGHVQIAQSPHRYAPQVKGEIDFEYVFELIRSSGYDGIVGLEFKPEKELTKLSLDGFFETYGLKL